MHTEREQGGSSCLKQKVRLVWGSSKRELLFPLSSIEVREGTPLQVNNTTRTDASNLMLSHSTALYAETRGPGTWGRITDEEAEAEKLSNMPEISQLLRVQRQGEPEFPATSQP